MIPFKKFTFRFRYTLAISTISILLLAPFTGCGRASAEMHSFEENMTTFYENIAEKNDKINALDPEAEASVDELLSLLDGLQKDFAMLDSIEIPEEYSVIDQLASEGKQYMDEAVRLYHLAFEGDDNYANILVAAKENYRRANVRLQCINDVLQGNQIQLETQATTQ